VIKQAITFRPNWPKRFLGAVYHYRHVWTPGTPEITRKLSNGSFTMIGVCDLVDKFTDPLPDGLFDILRSETHLGTDVSALDADLSRGRPASSRINRCQKGSGAQEGRATS
jgi:hypothetical protein